MAWLGQGGEAVEVCRCREVMVGGVRQCKAVKERHVADGEAVKGGKALHGLASQDEAMQGSLGNATLGESRRGMAWLGSLGGQRPSRRVKSRRGEAVGAR